MTFNQWWDGLKWSFIMRIFVEPLAKLFSEIAWNAAVRAEREACAKVCEECGAIVDGLTPKDCAAAIRAREKS